MSAGSLGQPYALAEEQRSLQRAVREFARQHLVGLRPGESGAHKLG